MTVTKEVSYSLTQAPSVLKPVDANADEELRSDLDVFLEELYEFRRNALRDITECRRLNSDDAWTPVNDDVINTITRQAKRAGITKGVKTDIKEYVYSTEVKEYNPVTYYLDHCPEWDGEDRVTPLFARIPGITPQQIYWAHIWLMSCMAHWLGMDSVYGNQCVITLIGDQGCGKSVFAKLLLPPELRDFYMDHVDFSNNFSRDMALACNLLINLDEIDQFKQAHQAKLKFFLTTPIINSRPIYGRFQVVRPRYASFIATTNNRHPLLDETGSRRFACISIPSGEYIDNSQPIDYRQLMAQLRYQVEVEKRRYWFSNEEVADIQRANLQFYHDAEYISMVAACVRKPQEGETPEKMNTETILARLTEQFPHADFGKGKQAKIQIGVALHRLGIEYSRTRACNMYHVIPLTPSDSE